MRLGGDPVRLQQPRGVRAADADRVRGPQRGGEGQRETPSFTSSSLSVTGMVGIPNRRRAASA